MDAFERVARTAGDIRPVKSKFNESAIYNGQETVSLYHGTSNLNFKLDFKFENPNNDYGKGLYLTPSLELAKEWAMSDYGNKKSGIAVEYLYNTSGLKILDLRKLDSLYWASILLSNRRIDDLPEVVEDNVKLLQKHYYIDVSEFDIIIGFRADDSYYAYMSDFISGLIYRETFDRALSLGKLGIQYCLKSERSFDRLTEIKRHKATNVDRQRYINRDTKARRDYYKIRNGVALSKLTIVDILRGEK